MVPNMDCRADVSVVLRGTVCEPLWDSQYVDERCHPTGGLHLSKHLEVSCEWLTVISSVFYNTWLQ